MVKKCIVNVVLAEEYQNRYTLLQERMVKSFKEHSQNTHIYWWKNEYPENAPTDQPLPYAAYCAKPFAMLHAMNEGWEIVTWVDSACFAIKDVQPFFDQVEKDGYYFQYNGNTNGGFSFGEWCSDAALERFGISRDLSLSIPECSSMVISLDLRKSPQREFLKEWAKYAADGTSFPGYHTNDIGHAADLGIAYRAIGRVSEDSRVFGHRHDQTAASYLIHKFGFHMTPRPILVDYYANHQNEQTVIVNNGEI